MRCARLAIVLAAAAWLAACASQEVGSPAAEEATVPIVVEGADEVDEDELLAAARRDLRDFQKRGRASDLEDAAYSMTRELRAQGHPFGRAFFERQPEKGAIERVVFRVEEGPAPELGEVDVRVQGDGAGVEPMRFFEPLIGDSYRSDRLETAMSELEAAYLLAGFYEVEVGPLEEVFSKDRTTAHPVVPVAVGPRFVMKVRPYGGKLGKPIRDLLPDRSEWDGKPFHVRRPAELASRIRKALQDEGYQLAEVRPSSRIDHERHVAEISIAIEPGPVLRLRRVEVTGLDPEVDRTDPDFVRSALDLEPGQPLAQEALDAAVDRLYRTGIFSRIDVELHPQAGEDDPRDADVEVSLDELDARTVDFEVGFGSYELLRGGVSYRDRNLFGAGRVFDAQLRGSLRSAELEFGLTDPYTLGRPNTILLRAGTDYRQEPTFDRLSVTFSAAVRHDLDSRTSITGGYRLRYSDVSNVTADLPDDVDDEGPSTRAGLFVGLRHDARDNPVIPVDGRIVQLGTFWSTPALLADLSFLELTASYFEYVELWDGGVLAWGGRAATREILNDDSTLPIQERLFLGGESSVRSFAESELGPSDAGGDPLGGLSSAEAHVELRQRVVGSFHVALFYDVGVVNAASLDFTGPYGHAVGIGLRYYLPIGPARLDVAYNPGRRFAADGDVQVHFGFGFSF